MSEDNELYIGLIGVLTTATDITGQGLILHAYIDPKKLNIAAAAELIKNAKSFADFCKSAGKTSGKSFGDYVSETLEESSVARRDFNEARVILGQKPFRLRKPKAKKTAKNDEAEPDSEDAK